MSKKIIVLGGDGFCGWPTALHLSKLGHDVTIVDNLSRREIDLKIGASSLTPIQTIQRRLNTWSSLSGKEIQFKTIDVAKDYEALKSLLACICPDTVVHFAEQRAAPYSMRSPVEKMYTVNNNINATHNLLVALADLNLDTHIVHLGTMGVYGYDDAGLEIPEGYLPIKVQKDDGELIDRNILYPTDPGSVYHMTKSMDQIMFQFFVKNDNLRITDLHQGIVWGTQTEETRLSPLLKGKQVFVEAIILQK